MRMVVLSGLIACVEPRPLTPPPPFAIPPAGVDLLLVIDNSSSMADRQAALAQDLAGFVDALDALPGGRPDLHVGIVSTTVAIETDQLEPSCGPASADDGLLQNTARVTGCTPPTDRYISDIARGSSRATNYPGDLASALACIAPLGTSGCGIREPLEAIRRALDGTHAENAGFRRPDAALVVAVFARADDVSLADQTILDSIDDLEGRLIAAAYTCDAPISTTVAGTYHGCTPATGGDLGDTRDYVDFLATVVDPSQLLVEVIAGPADGTVVTLGSGDLVVAPSCASLGDTATPAIRLADVTARLGDHGAFASVCQSDYAPALMQLVAKLAGQ